MKTNFLCPKCLGYLSVGRQVIFCIKNKKNVSGLLLLSPTLGDYSYEMHPSYQILTGEKLQFYCPICHASLSLDGIEDLASIIMQDENNDKHYVIFSQKEGEKCTYKISNKTLETFGKDASAYIDFISASMLK